MADTGDSFNDRSLKDHEDEIGDQAELQPGKNVSLNLLNGTGNHDLNENLNLNLNFGNGVSEFSSMENFTGGPLVADQSNGLASLLVDSSSGVSTNSASVLYGVDNICLTEGGHNAEHLPVVSPPLSSQTWIDFEMEGNPAKLETIQVLNIDALVGQSEIQKNANELFQDFLKTPVFEKQSREFFVSAACRYLIDSGNYEKNPDASKELIRSLKVDDILGLNGKLGSMYISQFLEANCFVSSHQAENNSCTSGQSSHHVTATFQCQEQMDIDNQSQQVITAHDFPLEGTNAEVMPEQKMTQVVQLLHQPCGDIPHLNIPDTDQSSSGGKHLSKQTLLLKKIEGHLNLAYTKMEQFDDSTSRDKRSKKIKIGGEVLFSALFTRKEIVEGNVSGSKTRKNKMKQKYDEEKVALLSQLLAWLLDKPRIRNVSEFIKYQEQKQSVGLVGTEYEMDFKHTVLVDHANYLRSKYN